METKFYGNNRNLTFPLRIFIIRSLDFNSELTNKKLVYVVSKSMSLFIKTNTKINKNSKLAHSPTSCFFRRLVRVGSYLNKILFD